MARAAGFDDLGDILDGLRRLPELDEVKPGLADVRSGNDWGDPIELPLGRVSRTASTKFLREVRKRLRATVDA